MPETEWLLVVYRLPPRHARLHDEVERRVNLLGPIPMQRSTMLVHDSSEARSALTELQQTVEHEGGSLVILRSTILAGLVPAAGERR
jgi:hypothetical protein